MNSTGLVGILKNPYALFRIIKNSYEFLEILWNP